MPWLINSEQLERFRKSQKSLIILDTTWYPADSPKNAKQAFLDKHIIGAQFFDINVFSDPNSHLPNMLLQDEALIGEKLSALGIRNDYKIIMYDNSDAHTSCRALWMFKMFGHNPHQLYILDGGLKAWEADLGKTESGEPSFSAKQYTAKWQPQFLVDLPQMKKNLLDSQYQVVDVRHPVRFCGGPESRPGIRSGHIPGSFSFPYFTMFEADGKFKSLDKIRKKITDSAISFQHPIISTCGSGITAPIFSFVLDLFDHEPHAVYNGSWTEWGNENLYPGETSVDERPVDTCLEE